MDSQTITFIKTYLETNKVHNLQLKQANIGEYRDLVAGRYICKLKIDEEKKELLKAKVKIMCRDILEHSDECLVNAANELLLGGGGVDGAVHTLGG